MLSTYVIMQILYSFFQSIYGLIVQYSKETLYRSVLAR